MAAARLPEPSVPPLPLSDHHNHGTNTTERTNRVFDNWRTTNVVMDGKLHRFNHGTPQEYTAERALIQGVASMRDERTGTVVTKPRTIIVTRERGRQELACISMQ